MFCKSYVISTGPVWIDNGSKGLKRLTRAGVILEPYAPPSHGDRVRLAFGVSTRPRKVSGFICRGVRGKKPS